MTVFDTAFPLRIEMDLKPNGTRQTSHVSPEMILLIGIPGSGKSTYCQQYFSEYRIISLDTCRSRRREENELKNILAAGSSCVIDNTNVTKLERARFISAGKAAGYRIVGYYFQSKVDDCLRRNAQRAGAKCIPKVGILERAKHLETPEYSEGFDGLFYVKMENGMFSTEKWKEDETCRK